MLQTVSPTLHFPSSFSHFPFAAQEVQLHFRTQAREDEGDSEQGQNTARWGTSYLVDDILRTRIPRETVDLIHDSGTLDSIAMTLPAESAASHDPFAPPPGAVEEEASMTGAGGAAAAQDAEEDEGATDDGLSHGSDVELCSAGIQGYFTNVCALLRPRVRGEEGGVQEGDRAYAYESERERGGRGREDKEEKELAKIVRQGSPRPPTPDPQLSSDRARPALMSRCHRRDVCFCARATIRWRSSTPSCAPPIQVGPASLRGEECMQGLLLA